MKIKLLSAVAVLATGFAAAPAFADEASPITVTGSAAIVSQYKFRGLTQSDSKPAVQASITVSHSSGFYVSMWGSSGASDRFGPNSDYISPNGGTEIDVYGGYTKALAGVTVDVGLYGYIYPNLTAANIFEVYGSVAKTFGPLTAKVGVNWAPKQHYFTQLCAGGVCPITQYSVYEYGALTYANGPFTVHGSIGHTGGGLDFLGVKQYLDFNAGVSYKWKALTFDISAVGTDISKGDIETITGFAPGTYGNVSAYRYGKFAPVASLTASF
jgi:uncharacterized protein (TIGR02001 family)